MKTQIQRIPINEGITLHEPVNELQELKEKIEALENRKSPISEAINNLFLNFKNSPISSISGLLTGGVMIYKAYELKDVLAGAEGLGVVLGFGAVNEKAKSNDSNII
jgi:hypothetical protein